MDLQGKKKWRWGRKEREEKKSKEERERNISRLLNQVEKEFISAIVFQQYFKSMNGYVQPKSKYIKHVFQLLL